MALEDPLASISISASLRTALARSCDELRRIQTICGLFWGPVDILALQIPDYNKVIKYPMDLLTLKQKLELEEFATFGDFINESSLIWQNCKDYNKNAVTQFYINAAEDGEKNFIQEISKQAGPMLPGFSPKNYIRIKAAYMDKELQAEPYVNIYNESLSISCDLEFDQLLEEFLRQMNALDDENVGELVDYYLRKKSTMIQIGTEEIEMEFNENDYDLLKEMYQLAKNKAVDQLKKRR